MRSEKVAELVRGMRKPEAWTKQNFLDWIIYLTNSKVDKSFARIAYAGKEGGHQARVLSQLREAFFSPVSSGKASNPALKVALRYLAKSGATHIDLAHELHDRAADLGIKMDTGVWNFLLECSVKAKDLLGFRARLRRMISKGFVPSFRTWILFLRLVEADEVKRYVIQGIHMKGYLSSPGFVQRVADEMMDSDAYRAGKLGLSWEAHLDGLQKLYGPDWIFTISNANKTIAQYVRNDQFAQALRVVEYMFETKEKDYQKPNEITMNTLLQSCHIQRRADRALTVLRVFEKNGRLGVADDVAYHYLFELAWKLRRPHMLAAVWRYAHLVNKVSARMRHRGLSILQGGEAVDRFRLPWHVAATQKEVMEKLLLWDYKMEGFDTDPPAAEEEEEEEEEQTEANATTTMMNSTTTATEIIPKTAAMRAKEQEVVSILATPLDEQPEAMKSGGLTDALNKTTGVPISPRLRQRYRGFEEWSLGRYLIGVPGTSLSRFLEKAAEEDEKLLEAVKKGGGVAPAGEVEAPELPVRIRDRAQQADLIKRMRRLDHGSGSGGGGGGGGSSSEGGSQRFKAILEFAEKATGL
ncbi:hypothetical protein QBC42DRAFT_265673 [Cladorrhinum samala]|uniref:Pentatricopeptide repeat-containing protein n=1 Tax=Cladorrhinum samala TaxID=585594 RepID=A0AAV9HSX8_9PEZI|nr:hypothetical protein QBC42DRAFT_265673 [Cladorrhinum samala]